MVKSCDEHDFDLRTRVCTRCGRTAEAICDEQNPDMPRSTSSRAMAQSMYDQLIREGYANGQIGQALDVLKSR